MYPTKNLQNNLNCPILRAAAQTNALLHIKGCFYYAFNMS